ncbi:MAG TPA: RidA family protein [Verrucomicrobiae bacterium]|nr:RidA family protein [Verrucomicrobiae bacterium]
MAERRLISSGSAFEPKVGYSRAIRIGDAIFVSGTVGDGADVYEQSKAAIATIEAALHEAGASLDDVVRTRIFVTNIDDWQLVARAHREAFGEILPACSMLEVSRLIAPQYLVEIEADALV